jgi:hypothetical protein
MKLTPLLFAGVNFMNAAAWGLFYYAFQNGMTEILPIMLGVGLVCGGNVLAGIKMIGVE